MEGLIFMYHVETFLTPDKLEDFIYQKRRGGEPFKIVNVLPMKYKKGTEGADRFFDVDTVYSLTWTMLIWED